MNRLKPASQDQALFSLKMSSKALSITGATQYSTRILACIPSLPMLVGVVAFVGILVFAQPFALLSDADTYWHLAAGRWIIVHGSVPAVDPFSHSIPGAPWTTHEWLSEVLLATTFQLAGWPGLVITATLAFAVTLAYLTRFLLARMEPIHALLLTALSVGMLAGHLLVRPHVLAWPLLALWIGTLVNSVEARRGPPWWLLGLMVLWANVHGSFTLGLALGAVLALDAVLLMPSSERVYVARAWVTFTVLSAAAAMMTPAGWKGFWYTLHVMNLNLTLDVVGEWASPDFHHYQPLEVWLLFMLCIALVGRARIPLLRLVLLVGLLHLALKHQRNVAVLGLIAPFLVATSLANVWYGEAPIGPDLNWLDRLFRALARPSGHLAASTMVMAITAIIALAAHSERYHPAPSITPERAVQAAFDSGAQGRVLNGYNFGGYLIYRNIPVFVDGRSEMYGDAFMEKLLDALALKEHSNVAALLDNYRIGWTLLEPNTPAIALLDHMPGWRRVYADEIAVVHVHDSSNVAAQ